MSAADNKPARTWREIAKQLLDSGDPEEIKKLAADLVAAFDRDEVINNHLPSTLVCSYCNKPIDITSAKTDEIGRAVHEDCYVLKMYARLADNRSGFRIDS